MDKSLSKDLDETIRIIKKQLRKQGGKMQDIFTKIAHLHVDLGRALEQRDAYDLIWGKGKEDAKDV
jgi:hypothetical protein